MSNQEQVMVQSIQAECINLNLRNFVINKVNKYVDPVCLMVAFDTPEGKRVKQPWHAMKAIDGYHFLKGEIKAS